MALDTVPELLAAINRLPAMRRAQARLRVEQAITRPAIEARAALGLLALELASDVVPANPSFALDDATSIRDGALQHV